ncbi:MAG TPA: hypothetical protein PLA68_04500 [Panacibacter sp.]|nr:hypothetical protein [Panacibacter sp.]
MKKLVILTLLSAVVFNLYAQLNPPPAYQQYLQQKKIFEAGKQQKDALIKLLPQKPQQTETVTNVPNYNVDNMPVAGNKKLPLTFIGNNENGLDIFRSGPDNMYILKPDATFLSAMPTGNFKVVTQEIKTNPGK